MATIVCDCPHCGAKRMTFKIQNEYLRPETPQQIIIGASCGACAMPIVALFHSHNNLAAIQYRTADYDGNLMGHGHQIYLQSVYPHTFEDDTPKDIPESVRKIFIQAAASLRAKHYDAASGMYRKAMELALKEFSPDIEAWKIEKRIDQMAVEHRITPELKAWAHELRLDGNDGMHGLEEANKDTVDQMHEFCKFLLIYLYTLPAQVKAAQTRRKGN